jgi:PD-(D/E)XK nuclease superfamily
MEPLPWSHSALTDYKNCQRMYYHKRVAKDVTDPPNEAGLYGDYVHKSFEAYLRDHTKLPSDLLPYKAYLDALRQGPGEMFVECKYAITKEGQPCDFKADDVWCRAIIDWLRIDGKKARLLDHKTGKRKFDTRQIKLNALLVFMHHPQVLTIKAGYMWLKDTKLDKHVYTRREMPELWNEFLADIKQYEHSFHTMTFGPRPSGLCNGWCPVTNCEFWKPKRR